jgi:hypothetical protein
VIIDAVAEGPVVPSMFECFNGTDWQPAKASRVSSVTATGRLKVIIKTPEASRARPEMVGQLDLSC